MKWSWKLVRIAGIDVKIHATFLLLLGWIALVHWREGQGVGAVVEGVAFVLLIFLCVVLHEFGHALTAKRYGVRTRDIILLPIGGVARLERMPEDPRQELWVAVAGPAVNVAIAGLLWGYLTASGALVPAEQLTMTGGSLLQRLLIVNVVLVLFNLIPAFPMDGGRVLRALLAMRLEYTRATQIAAEVGQALALLLGFLGLFFNPFLVFIALFVWIGAAQEASMVQMKAALSGIPLRRVMITDFHTLAPSEPLSRAIDLTLAGTQQDFPVLDGEQLVGILTQNRLVKALAEHGPGLAVGEAMQRDFQPAHLSEMIEPVFLRLQQGDCPTLPVLQGDDRLAGLVTMENLGEFLRIQAALRQ